MIMLDETSLSARNYLYTLFQSVFGSEATSAFFDSIDAELIRSAHEILGIDAPAGFLASLEKARSNEESMAAVKRDYQYLFIGPNNLPSEPWESVHISGENTLFQRSTLEVRNAYRVQGFLPQAYPRVADDHIALECGFLAAMAQRALKEWSEGSPINNTRQKGSSACFQTLKASHEFLVEHPLQWVFRFSKKLEEAVPETFYGAAAVALCVYLKADVSVLEGFLAQG